MKKNKSSKNWIIKQHRDEFFKQAKSSGYRSRSAFKLLEINQKYKFLKRNCHLLDLGSSPGGWSQVSAKTITCGKILAVDIKEMPLIKNVNFLKLDFLDDLARNKIFLFFKKKIDVVISDMAANTTGNKSLDCIRTNELCFHVLDFAEKIMKKEGTVVAKIFMGEEFKETLSFAKKKFITVNTYKPKSSRDDSKETYIHCQGLKSL